MLGNTRPHQKAMRRAYYRRVLRGDSLKGAAGCALDEHGDEVADACAVVPVVRLHDYVGDALRCELREALV